MQNHDVSAFEPLAQAFLGWLELLAPIMHETARIEVSGFLIIAALIALEIYMRRRR